MTEMCEMFQIGALHINGRRRRRRRRNIISCEAKQQSDYHTREKHSPRVVLYQLLISLNILQKHIHKECIVIDRDGCSLTRDNLNFRLKSILKELQW